MEGPETVELSFGALASGFSAGSTAVATVTITDTDTAAIEFSAASSEVSEGGETELTFAIANGVVFAVDQAIAITAAGSADAGDDFVLSDSQNRPLSAPYSVTLAARDSSVTARLRVLDDFHYEGAETVVLSARLDSTGTLIGSRTVMIPASDLEASVVTIASHGAVSEGEPVLFTLSRTNATAAPLAEALTVRVKVTATGGVLSGAAPSTVTFAAGDDTAELRASTVEDTVVEDAAAVTALVTADTASPARYEAGSPNSATVTVRDDDTASFSVSAGAPQVVEGDTATVTMAVDAGVTFARAQTLSVTVAGTATLGDDFVLTDANGDELVAPHELTLSAGAGSTSLRIAAAVDDVEDDGETVVLVVLHDGGPVGTATVEVADTNERPVVAGLSELSFAENAMTDVAAFTATDAEGDQITWSLAGNDAARFDIAGGTLAFRAPPDFEMPADRGANNVYDVTVQASDSEGSTSHDATVTVTDVDEAATLNSVSGTFVFGTFVFGHDENNTAQVAVFTASDPERAEIRWTLGGTDGAVFEISDRGVLSFLRPPDFEHPADDDADNEYLLQVQARAGANDPVAADVTVNVANVDEPGVLVLSSPQPQTGTPLEAAVSDPDGVPAAQAWIWQRKQGNGPWSNVATARSYTPVAADVGYDLRVEATYLDGTGTGSDTAEVQAPHSTRAAPSTYRAPDFGTSAVVRSVAENAAPGAAVGAAVTAADTDPGDAQRLAYTLSGAAGGLFDIDSSTGQIRVGQGTVLDYEAAVRSYSVTVTATDPSGASGDISVTVAVADVNEAPSAGPDTATAAEDSAVVVAVLTNDTDPDGDTLTVARRDAPLHGRVAVQADNTLAYTPARDFNGKDIFTYTASDGRLTHETTVTVTVNAVNDQPKFPSTSTTRTVAEGAPAAAPVGRPVTAADVDGEALTYGLFEVDAPFFTIDADTGQIRVGPNTVPDRRTQPSYRLRVQATDPHGARVSTAVTVTVTAPGTTTGPGPGGGGDGGPAPVAGVEISGAAFAAPGAQTTFSIPDVAGFETITWAVSGPGGFSASSDGQQFSFMPTTAGLYTVTVTATGPDGETHTNTVTLAVFGDIAGSLFADDIVWLAGENITVGCTQQPLRYCPNRPVTRAQMASFLTRALGLETPPQPAGFADVDPDSVHAASIEALHTAGITVGCTQQPLRYCPNRPVTRAQMASFLTRALGLETPPQPAGFADVDPDSVHAASIEALHTAGITVGCTQQPLQYCPNRPVTRAQMAAFLHRARDLIATAHSTSSN